MKKDIKNYKDNKEINSLEDLIIFESILKESKNCYFFRGQFNHTWKLESSYKRWIHKINEFDEKRNIPSTSLLEAVSSEIEQIKQRMPEKNNLEILSELQHYGSATLLIDFTTNFWNAIWFAISENNSKESEFFRIYYFNSKNNEKEEYDIVTLEDKKVFCCPDKIQNALAQKSYFILDNLEDLENFWNIKSILIPFSLRDKLLKYLDINKINSRTIFPGLKGLYQEFQNYSKEFMFINGVQLAILNEYERSLGFLNKTLKQNSTITTKSSIFHNKGIISYKNQEYINALKYFDQAIKLNKNYLDAYIHKGQVLYTIGKYDEALDCFNYVINLKPKYFKVYNSKGTLLGKMSKPDEALECFEKAILFNPNNVDAYINKGIALDMKNNDDKSLKYFEKAIKMNSNHRDIYINKATLLEKNKNYTKSLECLTCALKLGANRGKIYIKRGKILAKMNRNSEAIKSFNLFLKLKSEDVDYIKNAKQFEKEKKYDESLECLNHVLNLKIMKRNVHMSKMDIFHKIEDIDELLKCLEYIFLLNKECINIYNNQGSILSKINNYDLAWKNFDEAVNLNFINVAMFLQKGYILTTIKEKNEAIKWFEEILQFISPPNDFFIKEAILFLKKEEYEDALNSISKVKIMN